jgi:hypothetical protein
MTATAEFRSSPAIVQVIRDKAKFFRVVYYPVVFYSAILNRELVAPIGFETDFASIPQFLKDRIEVNGKHREAAIIHDYLCIHHLALGLSQYQSDLVFREAMQVLGESQWRIVLMYNGVKLYQKFQCWKTGEAYK